MTVYVSAFGETVPGERQLLELERYDLEDSLYLFLKSAWRQIDPSPWLDGWPIEAIAEHLQAVVDGDIRRLMTKDGPGGFDMKASDVMTKNCKRVRLDALAAEATAIFHKHRIDELPVVDADDKPVGLIDVQDIVTIKVVG